MWIVRYDDGDWEECTWDEILLMDNTLITDPPEYIPTQKLSHAHGSKTATTQSDILTYFFRAENDDDPFRHIPAHSSNTAQQQNVHKGYTRKRKPTRPRQREHGSAKQTRTTHPIAPPIPVSIPPVIISENPLRLPEACFHDEGAIPTSQLGRKNRANRYNEYATDEDDRTIVECLYILERRTPYMSKRNKVSKKCFLRTTAATSNDFENAVHDFVYIHRPGTDFLSYSILADILGRSIAIWHKTHTHQITLLEAYRNDGKVYRPEPQDLVEFIWTPRFFHILEKGEDSYSILRPNVPLPKYNLNKLPRIILEHEEQEASVPEQIQERLLPEDGIVKLPSHDISSEQLVHEKLLLRRTTNKKQDRKMIGQNRKRKNDSDGQGAGELKESSQENPNTSLAKKTDSEHNEHAKEDADNVKKQRTDTVTTRKSLRHNREKPLAPISHVYIEGINEACSFTEKTQDELQDLHIICSDEG